MALFGATAFANIGALLANDSRKFSLSIGSTWAEPEPTMRNQPVGWAFKKSVRCVALAVIVWAPHEFVAARAYDDAKDWPMYNHDVVGTRYNPAETAINPSNAGRLEEKWRFPARDSQEQIGVIHATPVVVNGYVYFGTATEPAFYKLAPDGKVRWSYRRKPLLGKAQVSKVRLQSSDEGIMTSPLVTDDTVYFADLERLDLRSRPIDRVLSDGS